VIEGVLVVDKPEGMTSHDVVAFARRSLGQSRIGHTGTLDPFATGVLPLACGRATRLVRFMSAADKTYEGTIRFGLVTDTYDITGTEVARTDARPSADAVLATIETLRGEPLQTPPSFSAKKVGGRRAYDLARKQEPVALAPVAVRLRHVDIISLTPERALVRLTCSAGYYVRSFAHDLGTRLGVGACLETLRRTRSGHFELSQAITLSALDAGGGPHALIRLEELLPELDAVVVGATGRDRVRHGQTIRPEDLIRALGGAIDVRPGDEMAATDWVRVIDEAGALLGVAKRGAQDEPLRPNIVLT